MKLANKYFVKELWTQFKRKIEKEWTSKYSEYGDSLKKANNLTTLASAIHSDITKSLNGRKIKVSNSLIIYNYLKSDTLSDKAHLNTLDMFSAYLGYKNWEEFCENNKSVVEAKVEGQEGEYEDVVVKDERWKYLWFVVPVICLILGGMWWKNSTSFTDVERDLFKNVILKANKAEINAYKRVPQMDTTELYNYYTNDSKGKDDIISRIKRKMKDSCKVCDNIYGDMIDINYDKKTSHSATVRTTENWKVFWCNQSDSLVGRYKKTVEHIYTLKEENGTWKIENDIFGKSITVVESPQDTLKAKNSKVTNQ
jgi:hypothetical protein